MMSTIAHLMAYGLVVVYGTGKNSFSGELRAGGGSDFTDRVVSSASIPNYEKFQKLSPGFFTYLQCLHTNFIA
nr:MAG: hypothetical protein [Bacteriophage sp.]